MFDDNPIKLQTKVLKHALNTDICQKYSKYLTADAEKLSMAAIELKFSTSKATLRTILLLRLRLYSVLVFLPSMGKAHVAFKAIQQTAKPVNIYF